jgi:putative phosphoesterase
MHIAIISDIHGNLVALESVLSCLEKETVDQIISLGDVAAFGPQPKQVIQRLQEMQIPSIMGNTDAWLLDPEPHPERDENTFRYTEIETWSAHQLTKVEKDYIRTFQPTIEIQLDKRKSNPILLCYHGSPRSNLDAIEPWTPTDDLKGMISGFHSTVMAGGHTHVQMLRRYEDIMIINPGSVGIPVIKKEDGREVCHPPWAEFAILTYSEGEINITFNRVPYDVEPLFHAAYSSGMPLVEWWLEPWRNFQFS